VAAAQFPAAYSSAADRWLGGVCGPPRPGVAVVAVGGYGRHELCPGSDLDIVVVHRGLPAPEVKALADAVLYPLWDTGVRVDHSVRTLREALRLAEAEMEVAVGLLDARCAWGDPVLVAELAAGVRTGWQRSARRRLAELADAVDARHGSAGEVAFMLEPDLKAGRGGLRDVVVLRAAAAGSPVVPPLGAVEAAAAVLLAVRVELHRRSGRSGDRLVLEDQDAIAAGLGYADADALMAAVAAAARTVGRVGDDAWRRVRSWIAGPRGRQGSADRRLGRGLALRDGEVVMVTTSSGDGGAGPTGPRSVGTGAGPGTGAAAAQAAPDPADDPSLALRAAAAAAETGSHLARSTLERLAQRQPEQSGPWPTAMRQALVALLATGHAAVAVFEELDEAGVLARVLPEWAPVRSRPQRNALHRFTVDRHLCEAAAEAAVLARGVARPDLLLVGTWLHDIGKGYPGDHTTVGMRLVADIGARMGFASEDVGVLVAMVEHHLVLPDVATRRDLDDPATIAGVARRVGSQLILELLAALAEADGRATGPAAWGTWKAGLVAELVARVGGLLAGEHQAPPLAPLERALAAVPDAARPAVLDALSRGQVGVFTEPPSTPGDPAVVAVVAPDRPGLLGLVAGTMVIDRLVVWSAVCASAPGGMVVDVFTAEHEMGESVRPEQLCADVTRALDGRLAVAERVAERVSAYAGRGRRRAARPAGSQVLFEETPSSTVVGGSTVVEVRAPDELGLLHRLALVFAGLGLDVRSAKVSTLGHEAVDTFSVSDHGGPLDPARWPQVEAAIVGQSENDLGHNSLVCALGPRGKKAGRLR